MTINAAESEVSLELHRQNGVNVLRLLNPRLLATYNTEGFTLSDAVRATIGVVRSNEIVISIELRYPKAHAFAHIAEALRWCNAQGVRTIVVTRAQPEFTRHWLLTLTECADSVEQAMALLAYNRKAAAA